VLQHIANWQVRRPDWLQIDALNTPYSREATAWQQAGLLDIGEAEALARAQHMNAAWLLTDDAAARLFAQSLGLEVHRSLGVVLWAAAVGYLTRAEAETALEGLAQSSLWISSRVLDEAKAALHRLFP
jgi:predicted nucleic acid-binding protein